MCKVTRWNVWVRPRSSYLWAGADIDMSDWGPHCHLGLAALTLLADSTAAHLAQAERYTVLLHTRQPIRNAHAVAKFHSRAQTAAAITTALRSRRPGLRFSDRAALAVQYIPPP